ncbi:MAG: LapA family protein [Deltaproteobacteria bacterium]|nr:LapA family protein [Deltaproteobacteria bacterium]
MKIFLNTCCIVAVLFVLIYFAMHNSQAVTLTYYNDMAETFPLWGLVIAPFFIGVIAGNLLDVVQRFKLSREVKKLRRELRQAQTGINR